MTMELVAKSLKTKTVGRGLFPVWVLQTNDGYFVQRELFGWVSPGTFREIKYTPNEKLAHTWNDAKTMVEWAKDKGYKITQHQR